MLSTLSADAIATDAAVWRFDDFILDLPRFELRRDGVPIRMEPQVFDVLVALVRNSHRVVTKAELFDRVWGGRFVGEAALTSRIKAVRRALGDDGAEQRYIRTVRGRGYQFVGAIDDCPVGHHPGRCAGIRRPTVHARPHRSALRRRALSGPPR